MDPDIELSNKLEGIRLEGIKLSDFCYNEPIYKQISICINSILDKFNVDIPTEFHGKLDSIYCITTWKCYINFTPTGMYNNVYYGKYNINFLEYHRILR